MSSRRYLITGGTSGIGAACAARLIADGAQVWVTGTSERSLASAERLGVAGGSVCDASVQSDVVRTFSEAQKTLGGLDGVFINGGMDGEALPGHEIDADNFRRVLDVNVVGTLRCAQAAHSVLDRPGAIVLNASVNATRPEVNFADYNASKAATASLAQSLALDWARDDLAVFAVCPGYFPSKMTMPYLEDPTTREALLSKIPVGRFGQPEEIGALVSFLLSGQATFMTGASIPIAGASNV